MKRQAGMTLLEVLIAVTLLSLLTVGMFMALRIGLSAFSRTDARLMENRRVAGAQRIIGQELEGLLPAMVSCKGAPTIFFQGLPDTLTMVSTFSLQEASRGRPQILQFFIAPSDEGGGMRLLVNETPYPGHAATEALCVGTAPDPVTGTPIPQFALPAAGPSSFVLADHLAYCRFKYLMAAAKLGEAGAWLPGWGGKGWPSGIRIEMAPIEPSPAQLQPVTVTAPVFITRDPGVQYVDR